MQGHRDHLEHLIGQVQGLQNLAVAVQDAPDDAEGIRLRNRLEHEYDKWFAYALNLVPGDRRAEFAAQYEGIDPGWRVAKFLAYARQRSNVDLQYVAPEARARMSVWQAPATETFVGPMREQKRILFDALARIDLGGSVVGVLEQYANIFRRLPSSVAAVARPARVGRAGLEVADEYGLQRVIHAILLGISDDVVEEEWGPSVMGSSPRIDFVVREHKVAVEAKFIHAGARGRKLDQELAHDQKIYGAHPDVEALLFVVYDPSSALVNPRVLEKDTDDLNPLFPVRLVVAS